MPAALPGIMTGILLALARIAGETAPLLFTALNNRFFSTDVTQPIATLTVQVFTYAISPYEDWHRQAWAGALVLVGIVVVCSLLARHRDGADGADAARKLTSTTKRSRLRNPHLTEASRLGHVDAVVCCGGLSHGAGS